MANPGMAFDEGRLADPFAQMADAGCADVMGGVDFASFTEDSAMPLPSLEPPPALNDADTFAKWVEEVGFGFDETKDEEFGRLYLLAVMTNDRR